MGRTPNDDRSDTLNPNNDAYWADQANRYGDYDAWDGDSIGGPPKQLSDLDQRFGPDPHPLLGKRANRFPSLKKGFDALPEELALAFATEESEARDRLAANNEFMRIAEEILKLAHHIMVTQGHPEASFEKADDGEQLTLRLRSDKWLVVRVDDDLLHIESRQLEQAYRTPLENRTKEPKMVERMRGMFYRYEHREWRGKTGAGGKDPAECLMTLVQEMDQRW